MRWPLNRKLPPDFLSASQSLRLPSEFILSRAPVSGRKICWIDHNLTLAIWENTGKTISGFSRATRMSTAATKVSQDIRFMTQAAFSTPDDEAALRKYFAWSASRMKSSFQNSTIYYSPYLANFYHDPASAQLVVSNYPGRKPRISGPSTGRKVIGQCRSSKIYQVYECLPSYQADESIHAGLCTERCESGFLR